MTSGAQRAQVRLLPDGRRLHLQDGPIDLVVEAFGPAEAVATAYRAAAGRFLAILDELCVELALLRRPAGARPRRFEGPVAARMEQAVCRLASRGFITPMAAVAGSVAEEVLATMLDATGDLLSRAYVNNGGDIALHLGPGESFAIGLVSRPDDPALFGRVSLRAEDGVGGIATSGAPGRSFSLGIADAVTILAGTASAADAAATVIANAVDLPGDARIIRRPARDLQPDSDLGDRPVTRGVAPLDPASIDAALDAGLVVARNLVEAGAVFAAALHLQGRTRLCGPGITAVEGAGFATHRRARPLPEKQRGEGGAKRAASGSKTMEVHNA